MQHIRGISFSWLPRQPRRLYRRGLRGKIGLGDGSGRGAGAGVMMTGPGVMIVMFVFFIILLLPLMRYFCFVLWRQGLILAVPIET